jgi:hypothetical protein
VKVTTRANLVRIFGYVMMAVAASWKQPSRTPLGMVEALAGTTSLDAEEIIREHDVCYQD